MFVAVSHWDFGVVHYCKDDSDSKTGFLTSWQEGLT